MESAWERVQKRVQNRVQTQKPLEFSKYNATPFGLLHFSRTFRNLRKRVAQKMQTPNLNRITFHTFRHWYATMLYHKTKKLLYVKEKLGHKSIITTTIYTHLINFESDTYDSEIAMETEEARKLVEAGFEYVTGGYDDGGKIFRKPK